MLPAVVVLAHRPCRSCLRRNWWILLILLALNFGFKLPFGNPFYHGLEYEDCFVHQAVGREFHYGQRFTQDRGSFYESIWSVGNLQHGDYYQTFFNPIGYATAIYLTHRVIGDRPSAGHWVSLAASCLSV